jgi:hypothetical protein
MCTEKQLGRCQVKQMSSVLVLPQKNGLELEVLTPARLCWTRGCQHFAWDLEDPYPDLGEMLALLLSAKDQFAKLTSFVNRFYQELTEVAKFSKGPAWLLVGRCVGAVFHEMASIRSRVSMLEEPHKLHAKWKMIWAVLYCHQVVASFLDVWFWGHTSIVREMSLTMLTEHVDPGVGWNPAEGCDAEAAAANTKAEFKKLSEKFVALSTEVASIKQQHNDLNNMYKQTKAKVDKI